MECIQGKQSHIIGRSALDERLADYRTIHIDLGTGDGRFVLATARRHPAHFVIGIDACRESLRHTARRAPGNALFVAANALALPQELAGRASRITINFPWGSLLNSLLIGDPALLGGLSTLGHAGAKLEVRVNGEALTSLGSSFLEGSVQIYRALTAHGLVVKPAIMLDKADLRAVPTTWAQRLAFGRDPRSIYLNATWSAPGFVNEASPAEVLMHAM